MPVVTLIAAVLVLALSWCIGKFFLNGGGGEQVARPPLGTATQETVITVMRGLLWLLTPVEIPLLAAWNAVPLPWKYSAARMGFSLLVNLNRILGLKLGNHPSLSIEAHAISSMMRFAKYIPMNLRRARLALNGIETGYPPVLGVPVVYIKDIKSYYIHSAVDKEAKAETKGEGSSIDAGGDTTPVLLYFFGGAFVGGSAKGNIGAATRIGRSIGCDVLAVETTTFPEGTITEAFADAMKAYEWVLEQRPPEKIAVLGISSGGGIATYMLQRALEKKMPMPAGLILLSPWLVYSLDDFDDFKSICNNTMIDFVVNPRVYEFVFPQMAAICEGEEKRKQLSPFYGPVKGLCPVHISYSLTEVCFDEDSKFAKRLREEGGVEVAECTEPYMMHAYQLFFGYIPESKATVDSACEWLKKRLA